MIWRVAVVEDSDQEADRLRAFFARYQAEKDVQFKIARFADAESFLSKCGAFDLVLMDIMLPGMNGMDAAARLRRIDPLVTLVFVTNMAQFAVKGYEVDAFDFIVKPVAYPHFVMKMDRVMGKLRHIQDKQLVLKFADGLLRLPVSQIKYIEVSAHSLHYHAMEAIHTVYGSLKKVEEELVGEPFARCNSCYLVNLSRVQAIDGYTVVVGGEALQISRAKRKAFLESLNNYLGENL